MSQQGPIDVDLWPAQLSAHVVENGPRPRILGYDVQEDLARYYSFDELFLLCLTGQAPTRATSRAFEIALTFLAPVSASEAPSHAAGLAHLLGADGAGVVACSAIGLAERARAIIVEHTPLLDWLSGAVSEFPSAKKSTEAADREAVTRLGAALKETGLELAVLDESPTLLSAILGVLHQCGLKQPAQLEAAVCIAGWPSVLAEAFAVKPYGFFSYPMNLPAFHYVEDPND